MSFLFIFILFTALLILVSLSKRFNLFSLRPSLKPKPKFHNAELVRVLLNLDEKSLAGLFQLYREKFGVGAAYYARRTYRKWKAGEVRPNRQTFERFLVHLPKVMSFDLKCEVLRHFMEEYAAHNDYRLSVYTDDWEEKLTPLVKELIDKPYAAQLPAELERKLRWLSEGEMLLAQKILRAAQVEEGKIGVLMLREEFANIERLLNETALKPKITHQLKFPCGTITLNIKRR